MILSTLEYLKAYPFLSKHLDQFDTLLYVNLRILYY